MRKLSVVLLLLSVATSVSGLPHLRAHSHKHSDASNVCSRSKETGQILTTYPMMGKLQDKVRKWYDIKVEAGIKNGLEKNVFDVEALKRLD